MVSPPGRRLGALPTTGEPTDPEPAGTSTHFPSLHDEVADVAVAVEVEAPLARLRGFHPGWYGAVMGTGIVAVIASMNPGQVASLASPARTLGQIMAIAAAASAVVLVVPYLGRFVGHPDAAMADLRDPVAGALYATFPGAILVLAAVAAAVGPGWWPASTVRDVVGGLAWVGVPSAFAVSLLFAYLLFVRSETVLETVNGGWFIPPVVNIVVPLVLVPLVPGSSPATARTLLLASYGFWGMGFVLYLLIVTMLYHRLVVHPLPHAALAPSLWIGLGPIGVGALALVKMAAAGAGVFASSAATISLLSRLAATALWGFGAWWLITAVLLLVHYRRSGPLPFGIGWWAFTFPLGAYTVATLNLARAWNLDWLEWAGAGLFVLLGLFWFVVASGTIWAVGTGCRCLVSSAPATDRPLSPHPHLPEGVTAGPASEA